MNNRSKVSIIVTLVTVLLAAPTILGQGSATVSGAGAPAPAPVNVLQDCWTTDLDDDPDKEKELYTFTTADSIEFVWKQKLLLTCTDYKATILGFDCVDGKRSVFGHPGRFLFANIPFAGGNPIDPDPSNPERIFSFSATPGSISPGTYDWILVTECNDTNGTVGLDGDIDDQCGINMGKAPTVPGKPLVLGPEPIELLDPDPGGSPPGRVPGDEGTTRGWCFRVTAAVP